MEAKEAQLPKIDQTLAEELKNPPQLKHAETEEKNILPSADEIQQQKEQQNLLKTIENFDTKSNLKHIETEEKNPLPTKEDIEQEKTAATTS